MNRRDWLKSSALVAAQASFGGGAFPASAQAAPPAITVQRRAGSPMVVKTPAAEFHITPSGYIQAFLVRGRQLLTLDDPAPPGLAGPAFAPDFLVSAGKQIGGFTLDLDRAKVTGARWKVGKNGKRIEMHGTGSGDAAGLEKTLTIEAYDDFPNLVVAVVSYKNVGSASFRVDEVSVQRHRLNASLVDRGAQPCSLWSFEGSAYQWGKDEVLRIAQNFERPNMMGGPGPKGLGGGIPVVDFWTASAGLAIGHVEPLPLIVSMPVQLLPDERIEASLVLHPDVSLKPGDSYFTPRTFVAVHAGDFYAPLEMWSEAVRRQTPGPLAQPTSQSYAANWCGWGYEEDFTAAQMTGTIPKLKELGIRWATFDYRWFNDYGDWKPRSDTFPDDSIRKVVDDFHREGIQMQIWWQPIAVEDGEGKHSLRKPMVKSRLIEEHPDWAILAEDGTRARLISPVSTAAALCPAIPEVVAYHKRLTEQLIRDWGFDGLKMDSVFTVPRCYNPRHHHRSPEDSIRAVGDVYKTIFETARAIKPQSVMQICPCGTVPSQSWLFYEDQAVTADPVGSIQVRRRIKMYKALLGPRAAVYGDHVELSGMKRAVGGEGWIESGTDFASTVGTGGVVGTKFTWPGDPPRPKVRRVRLTPDREVIWKKWIGIYNAKMLSEGDFRNLYTLGYDDPEAYAIEKDGKMYYAFFATSSPQWKGEIELRGLRPGKYRVVDYVNGKDLGAIDALHPKLAVAFTEHLLLEASRA